jgi:hypoxanthine-DNA glycosylase
MKKAFDPIIDENSRLLILGTMPGEKSLQLQQYYGNRGNQFWKILFSILNEPFSIEYDDRKLLLKKHGIALWDVLQFCERAGSLDSNIKNELPNDFDAFYDKYKNIKYVLFSSKNAAAYYDKYVKRKPHLTYDVLPSPSGANATKPLSEKMLIWGQKILPLLH